MAQGMKQGMAQGMAQANRSTAQKLHQMGISDEDIAKATSSSVGVVQAWIYQ